MPLNNSRIVKWKKYRQEILENKNIEESILNYFPQIKTKLELLNINAINNISNDKNDDEFNFIDDDLKKIEDFINEIDRNDNLNYNKHIYKSFNSHKYDINISRNFSEYEDNDFSDTKTTELKIKKISIHNSKKEE